MAGGPCGANRKLRKRTTVVPIDIHSGPSGVVSPSVRALARPLLSARAHCGPGPAWDFAGVTPLSPLSPGRGSFHHHFACYTPGDQGSDGVGNSPR